MDMSLPTDAVMADVSTNQQPNRCLGLQITYFTDPNELTRLLFDEKVEILNIGLNKDGNGVKVCWITKEQWNQPPAMCTRYRGFTNAT